MANEPKVLNVGSEEQLETVKGESGLSSAQVGTEAKVAQQTEQTQVGVFVANENQVVDNSKSLQVSEEKRVGAYLGSQKQTEYFERSVGEQNIVNTITVDETKALIKQSYELTMDQVQNMLKTVREGQYVKVDTETYPTLESFLESTGEQGTVYLYPTDNENHYDQYIWEIDQWIGLGSTELDLSGYVDLASAQTITGEKTISLGNCIKVLGNSYNGLIGNDNAGVAFYINSLVNKRLVIGNVRMTPGQNGLYDIGESSFAFKDAYLSGYLKGLTILTQAQYDALVSGGTVDSDTFYFIQEE